MNYPDNFETPAFPAGKRIAISRTMAIWSLTAFLIIVFLCGILLWTARSQRLSPILISEDWKIVGKTENNQEYSVARAMQESVVLNFARQWFRISAVAAENEVFWCRGDRALCPGADDTVAGVKPCLIYCSASDELYIRFFNVVLPDYKIRAANGEVWQLAEDTLDIASVDDKITELGGIWRIRGTIKSNLTEPFAVEAYITVARNNINYPRNLGFFVADFNGYKVGGKSNQ